MLTYIHKLIFERSVFMARETQKVKIERLEKELEEYKRISMEKSNIILQMQDKAENAFNNSPTYIQMTKQIESLEASSKEYKQMYENNRNKVQEVSDTYKKEIHKLKNEIIELKEMLNLKNKEAKVHNVRGAGRKSRFSNEEKLTIKSLREDGKTIKEIAAIYECSVGLVHKLINEK